MRIRYTRWRYRLRYFFFFQVNLSSLKKLVIWVDTELIKISSKWLKELFFGFQGNLSNEEVRGGFGVFVNGCYISIISRSRFSRLLIWCCLSYTGDNRMYFFKGDKYGVWDDSGDIFGSIGGKSKSVSFVCLCVLIWHFKSTKK